MNIKLIFDDWRDSSGQSAYSTDLGATLSCGDFHSGTTFHGTIELDEENEVELAEALNAGYQPVFWVASDAECPQEKLNHGPVIDFAIAVTRRYWERSESLAPNSWSPKTLRQIVECSILPYLARPDIYQDMLVELAACAMKAAMDGRKAETAQNTDHP